VEKYYLVCVKCNGYYELGESLDDLRIIQDIQYNNENFECSDCGGDVVLVEDTYGYYNLNNEYESYDETNKKTIISKSILSVICLLILVPILLFLNNSWSDTTASDTQIIHNHSLLSSDSRGYIVKDIYANTNGFNSKAKTIAIVTGMHPRENLSKNITSSIISKNMLSSGTQIVHYTIEVTNNPDNYSTGRSNGEGLAADYILPDILKSNDDLVIICHDHKPGYGEGYYIATPQMDENSMKLAESIKQSIPGFNYIRSDNIKESTSSAKKISKPLASAGYKTLIYEIPEWVNYNEAYSMTKSFIDQSFNFI